MTPEQRKLKDQALDAVSKYISAMGWSFGGDQCDFMWIDPLVGNLHFADDAFKIQLDRDMVKSIESKTPTDSTNPRSTPGEADAQNQTIMPNYEAFNRDLNLFLKESGDSIERFLSHEQKQREQYIEALRKHHDIPHEPDLPETGTQQDTPATVS